MTRFRRRWSAGGGRSGCGVHCRGRREVSGMHPERSSPTHEPVTVCVLCVYSSLLVYIIIIIVIACWENVFVRVNNNAPLEHSFLSLLLNLYVLDVRIFTVPSFEAQMQFYGSGETRTTPISSPARIYENVPGDRKYILFLFFWFRIINSRIFFKILYYNYVVEWNKKKKSLLFPYKRYVTWCVYTTSIGVVSDFFNC